MKVVELDQRSDAWHEWRRKGIGASEAPILLGEGYKTPFQLWNEKCGYASPSAFLTPAMAHGVHCEGIAQRWANNHLGTACRPLCVEDEELSYIRASLDGWDPDERILMEIKCPVNERVLENARKGWVLSSWSAQIQWQMMIANPRKAYLVVWDHRYDAAIVLEQIPDQCMMRNLRDAARKFWLGVKVGRPPPLTAKDYEEKEGEELKAAVEKFKIAAEEKKKYVQRYEEAREAVAAFGSGENFRAYGVTVTYSKGRPSYNHEQMRIDGIDLEKYARPGKGTYRVRAETAA